MQHRRTQWLLALVLLCATLPARGYGPGPGFNELYRMFQGGNAWSLAKLKQRFETGPVDWKAQLAPKLEPAPK